MRVYISVDMEGLAGVALREQISRHVGGRQYQQGRRLVMAEVNAAIEGAFIGGATDVIVHDNHGSSMNMPIEQIDPARTSIWVTYPIPSMQSWNLMLTFSSAWDTTPLRVLCTLFETYREFVTLERRLAEWSGDRRIGTKRRMRGRLRRTGRNGGRR